MRIYLINAFSSLILLNSCYLAKTEMFSAIVDMIPLIETQGMIIRTLKMYIVNSNQNNDVLKKHLKRFELEQNKALKDIPKYFGNPINAYTMIKRLTIDLKLIEIEIGKKTVFMKNEIMKFPSVEDLEGASEAMVRLRSTYRLNITQLVNGILSSTCSKTGEPYLDKVSPMSISDCYELGVFTYNNMNYYHSVAWLLEALDKYDDHESSLYNVTAETIVGYLHNAYSILGDQRASADWYEILIAPNPEKYKWLVRRHRERLAFGFKKINEYEDAEVRETKKTPVGYPRTDIGNKLMFEHLCRGDQKEAFKKSKNLKCYYAYGRHTFLSVAPVKTELLHQAPDVLLFHDIISDNEIQILLDYSTSHLSRATVINAKTGFDEVSRERVSKYAQIFDQESQIARKVNNRISAITGLDMTTAEGLQAINYGIGGHFTPHLDYFSNCIKLRDGDRIATVLFFFSDVILGGATVFTELGLRVHPVKGSALFWMNLHPSGAGDNATRHGGCPVLNGIKWIGNNWMHEIGQELIKPCGLKRI